MKIAVVTPYWQETPEVLNRCLATVRQQTLSATHYLVADGNPRELPADCAAVHLVLPENTDNCGSTPRGLGAQLAFNDGHDVVAFLDADNWLEPDHLQRAVSLLERDGLDVVFTRRTIVFPDGETLMVPDPQEAGHVDTSCHVMSKRAAFLAAVWALHPREFGAGEERLVLASIRQMQLRTAWVDTRTVWYESNWQHHYTLAGKQPVRPIRQPARRVSSHFDPQLYFNQTGISLPISRAPMAEAVTERPPNQWRVAVITPYRGESREALLRCAASVAIQGGDVVHYVVSDAETPCPADIRDVRHFVLPGTRRDHGNTARGLGAILAFQLGFDAVALLDANAWYAPDHLQKMLDALTANPGAPAVCVSPEQAGMTGSYPASATLLSRKAAYLGALWAQLPILPTEERNALLFMQLAAFRQVPAVAVQTDSLRTDAAAAKTPPPEPCTATVTDRMLFQKTGLRVPAQTVPPKSIAALKIAVVSPYWQETPEVLNRCLATVRQQTLSATHYLVADGNPRELPADCAAVHLVLPENAGNYGATPRGLGAQLAFNDGHDVVAFLDADNWLEPDHLERAVSLLERDGLDVVFARRIIVFPDGERLLVPDPQDAGHVDTNCYVISRRAAFLAAAWAMYPRDFGSGEDRLILAAIRQLQLRTAWMDIPTVWYESNWQHHYTLAGKQPVRPIRQPARRATSHFDPERYFHHTGIKLPFARAPMAEAVTERPPAQWRIAVITPYRGETRENLLRCAASVAIQGGDVVHYVVSDAETPCPADIPDVRHFVLPGTRRDHGNTARGLGAILAFQLGFDAVAFLDANAWYAPDHLRKVLHILTANSGALAVCAPIDNGESGRFSASAILITRKAAYLGAMWAQLPILPTEEGNARLYLQIAESRRVATVVIHSKAIGTEDAFIGTTQPDAHAAMVTDQMLFEKTGLRSATRNVETPIARTQSGRNA